MSDKSTKEKKADGDDLPVGSRPNRRVLLDAPDLQVPEDRVVRRSVVERAREDVAMGTVEEEVDMDYVVDSLLPDL